MKNFLRNLKLTWKYTKTQRIKILSFLILNIITIIIGIILPILSANQIIQLTNNSLEQLVYITLVVFGIEVLRNIVDYIARMFMQIIYRETFKEIQIDLGREILKIENKCLDENSSGVFIQRLTSDVGSVAEIFNVLNNHVTRIITNIGILIAIFLINKFALIFIIIMLLLVFLLEKRRLQLYDINDKSVRNKNESAVGFISELIRGARDIKMLNAEKSCINELKNRITDVNEEKYNFLKIDKKWQFFRGMTIDVFDTGIVFLLIYLILNQNLEVAMALVIYNYMGKVIHIVDYLGSLAEHIEDFNNSCERVFNIINEKEFSKEIFGKKHLEKVNGNFEFKDVSFAYKEDEIVLKDLSFKVNAKETVAFVGKTGSGKSTIFNLLCKMYDIKDGKITIDGVDIKELDKDSIRGNITIISQSPYIFNLSIRDNLKLVKQDLTENEMIDACKLACIHDFILTLKDGYDTIVGEGGISLSGGQRQRLAIARAFVQKTEIILLDEATSALDNETQNNIKKAIENLQDKYTILIIAHRLSTIINSDRILYLNDGKIEAEGTHKELLKNCKAYKTLYESEDIKIEN